MKRNVLFMVQSLQVRVISDNMHMCLYYWKINHPKTWGSLVAQIVKNMPAMLETQVQSLVRKIRWRREWQPTPVFLPGEVHGQRSLASYSPWSLQRVRHKWASNTGHLYVFGEISIRILCPVLMALFTFLLLSCMRFLYIFYFFLQVIFPTQGSNLGLLSFRQILCHLSHQGSSHIFFWILAPSQIYDMHVFSPI